MFRVLFSGFCEEIKYKFNIVKLYCFGIEKENRKKTGDLLENGRSCFVILHILLLFCPFKALKLFGEVGKLIDIYTYKCYLEVEKNITKMKFGEIPEEEQDGTGTEPTVHPAGCTDR